MTKISKVAIVMGSISDLDVVKPCLKTLDDFGISFEARVISAHRTPNEAHDFAVTAKQRGVEVIIGVAGKAAHLAGVLAAFTTLPVIALPISTKLMGGLDSLLSMVQMPKGVPVATVAVDGADNAGILAAQILGLKYPEIAARLEAFKKDMALKVTGDDKELQARLEENRK
ncbi:MAG: 5-(carboxyamino)imidazole ribonucleotide mutase [Firmicutes bacterium]|nr:5-(carboxyamino)imidazole ribonucleotide mutase [Bacillota bacterium]